MRRTAPVTSHGGFRQHLLQRRAQFVVCGTAQVHTPPDQPRGGFRPGEDTDPLPSNKAMLSLEKAVAPHVGDETSWTPVDLKYLATTAAAPETNPRGQGAALEVVGTRELAWREKPAPKLAGDEQALVRPSPWPTAISSMRSCKVRRA